MMKYLVALCVLFVACAATTGPQEQEPNYLGHYIGYELNDQPLELWGVDAHFYFWEDGRCQGKLALPDSYPVTDECTYTTPDEHGDFWIEFLAMMRYRGRFSEDGQYFTMWAEQNRWEFEKVGPA